MSQYEREPAKPVFAAELSDAQFEFPRESETDTRYHLLPTGEKIHRVYVCGVLVEVRAAGDDGNYLLGQVKDPAGFTYFVNAGEYQPEAQAALREIPSGEEVGITGKVRLNRDGDNVYIQGRTISPVAGPEFDAWVERAVEETSERIRAFQQGVAPYGERARDEYAESIQLEQYANQAAEAVGNTVEVIRGEASD